MDTSWGDFSLTKFWAQVHNIPLHGMIEEIGEMLGDQIGTCSEVDCEEKGRCIGRFICVRVSIDISKPLLEEALIILSSTSKILWVNFIYERLPEFCFICDGIGYLQREYIKREGDSYRKSFRIWWLVKGNTKREIVSFY